jgi:TetR/AcrR family transcriptional regulator, mexJK operon transcriptional repressor
MASGVTARSERTRGAIFAAAEELFLAHGYGGTSMDRIAALAGVTKQTVYSHVNSKEALFLEIVERMTGGAGDRLAEAVDDPADETSITSFLQDFAEQQLRIVLTPRLMQLRRMVIGEVGRFPELGAMLHERGPSRSIGRLERALEYYCAAKALNINDKRQAATFFNWLVMGEPVNDAMLLGDRAIPSKTENKRHVTECVRIFKQAFLAGQPKAAQNIE